MAAHDGADAVVHGRHDPRFARVREALAEILASGFEVGAALAVYVDKQPVIDLWGGHADAARTRPWQRDTIVNLYSVGKAVAAVCDHLESITKRLTSKEEMKQVAAISARAMPRRARPSSG